MRKWKQQVKSNLLNPMVTFDSRAGQASIDKIMVMIMMIVCVCVCLCPCMCVCVVLWHQWGNCYDMPVAIETSGWGYLSRIVSIPWGAHINGVVFLCVCVCVFTCAHKFMCLSTCTHMFGWLKHSRDFQVPFVCQFSPQGLKQNNCSHQLNDDKHCLGDWLCEFCICICVEDRNRY